jgi:hypothetical protein
MEMSAFEETGRGMTGRGGFTTEASSDFSDIKNQPFADRLALLSRV